MSEPREKTKEEVVAELIGHVRNIVRYWEGEERTPD